MEAIELIFKKYEKPSKTWRKVKEEINQNFFYLPEEDRIQFAELWDKLSSSKKFGIRKSRSDKSSDESIYFDLEDHFIKKLEKIKLELGY